MSTFARIGHFKDVAAFRAHLASAHIDLPLDDRILSAAQGSPLAAPITVRDFTIGNRWCIHPMEGWDATPDGRPSANTIRRWQRFGESGAKLIWGGEAFAIRHDGRANPNQLYFRPENREPMRDLLRTLTTAHESRFGKGAADDLLVGLQLTHSGRYCKPNSKSRFEPRIAYHHPLLDRRVGIAPGDHRPLLSDDDIKRIIDGYTAAARWAFDRGFRFVDVKACHGYLGHEFLSAYDRPGPYGGDLAGRSRFLREIIEGIRASTPQLIIGVRLSLFDGPPFHPDITSEPARSSARTDSQDTPPLPSRAGASRPALGIPENFTSHLPYPAFGCDRNNPLRIDLTEPLALLQNMRDHWGVDLVNLTAGSPYYNPHLQRPAAVPPSDGYLPPEDTLLGCARQLQAVRTLRQRLAASHAPLLNELRSPNPQLGTPNSEPETQNPKPETAPRPFPIVGTAYSYFQEFLPHIAQAAVREGYTDFVGLGRLALSYPDLPADCLEFGQLRKPKLLCRTFSDCTTAPRNGLPSGCYPLDDHYKHTPAAVKLKEVKQLKRG